MLTLQTADATFTIPGAYPSAKVQASASAPVAEGIIFLIGEADAGIDYSEEDDLALNSFGPSSEAAVIAKYKTGPLVDAFRAAVAAANDEGIQGSFNKCFLIKTNPSTQATSALDNIAGNATWATLEDVAYGKLGNLLYYTITDRVAEVKATTSSFTYIPPTDTTGGADITVRANGGTAQALTISANETPTAFVSALDGLTNVSATGGASRGLVTVSGTLALTHTAYVVTITRSVSWAVTPTVGDTLIIPAASVIKGAGNENVGAYVITAATSNTITATKLSDAGYVSAGAPGTITTPANVTAQSIVSTTADIMAYSPVTVSITSTSDGVGTSLEINQLATGTDLFERCAYVLGTTTPVTWISKTGSAYVIVAAAERQAKLSVNRQADGVSESCWGGGDIVLKLSYTGTTASAVITDETMTITVTGGSGTSPDPIDLADFPTINDLVAYLNSLTGFAASAGTAVLGTMSPVNLDDGTYTFGTTFGAYTGRIKADAYKFYRAAGSQLTAVELDEQPLSGLPGAVSSPVYLTGGTKGGTTDAIITAALAAMETVKGNFVVPLFSRDYTDDVEDGLTDSSSTYTIAAVHAATRSHCLAMCQVKRKKWRQAVLSVRDTFTACREASSNLASAICNCVFQDAKELSLTAGVYQFQPWMNAVKAAAMQAAGGYKAIFNKGINIQGALQAAGDFNDGNDDNVEDALAAGLMPIRRDDDGKYKFISDQTTYGTDNNFAYNSMQAMYSIFRIQAFVGSKMERAFVGQNVADVSAGVALACLESTLGDVKDLKLIAKSDDAPRGYRNAKIVINGPAMFVSAEVKLAGSIYFVPIGFLVSQVVQTASA